MNLNELKNIDIGAKFKALFANRTSLIKGPYAKTILLGVLGFLLLLAYVVFVFLPGLEKRQEMQKKVEAIPEMEARLKYLDVAIRKAEDDLFQAETSYAELNQLFSVESELEELYQRLSTMASSQGLIISSLAKDGEDAIYSGGKQVAGNQAPAAPPPTATSGTSDPAKAGPPPTPLFYRIKLKIELSGQYTHYMRFRKLLAEFDKSINIDKEQITLVPGDSRGMVIVKAQLSTFRLPNKLNTKPLPGNNQAFMAPSVQPVGDFMDTDMRYIKVGGIAAQDPLAAPLPEATTANPFAGNAKAEGRVASEENGSTKSPTSVLNPNASGASNRSGKSIDRDPFARSSSGMIEGGRDPRLSPLLLAPPESYQITGVIVSNSVKAAMIRTDFRENFIVRVGDRLGNQGGIISDIDLDGIVLKQANGRVRLYVQSQSGPQYVAPNSGAGR